MYRTRFSSALAMAALAAILLPTLVIAQITFQRTYGGAERDEAWSVRQTTDGGYIIAGSTSSFGVPSEYAYLVKTDAHGDTIWTRNYDFATRSAAYAVRQTSDGGYIIAGSALGPGMWDACLIKTDSHGDTMWTQTYGGLDDEYGYSVVQTNDGGFVLTGRTLSFGAGQEDVYLVRTKDDGDTMWTRTYGSTGFDEGASVQQTSDSGFIVTGSVESLGAGGADVCLLKTDARGDTVWARAIGGASGDWGSAVRRTYDGGYILVGTTYSFGAGGADVYAVKADVNGNILWTRAFGGAGTDFGYSVEQTTDSGYIIAAWTESFGSGYADVWLVRTDVSGDTLWTRTFGGDSFDYGHCVLQTEDGGYAVAGNAWPSGAHAYDVYFIKTDADGHVAVAEPKVSPTRSTALSLSCEPNPCRGATRVSFTPLASSSKPSTLRMYDSQGRVVLARQVTTSSFPLATSDLPAGAYFVRCDVSGEHATARLVLQH